MPLLQSRKVGIDTLADLIVRLGDVPTRRIRWQPYPGTATEQDLVEYEARTGLACELVDGVLVEKAMAWLESTLASRLIALLYNFVFARNLGAVTGEQGTFRLFPGLVRIPDVAFTSWARMPDGQYPTARIPTLAPDLAIEILSEGNTDAEMKRKREDYFAAGVTSVWIINPVARTIAVYTSVDEYMMRSGSEVVEGGSLLPGFQLSADTLFLELDRRQ